MKRLNLIVLAICAALVLPALADEQILSMSRGEILGDTTALPTQGLLVSGQPDAGVLDALKVAGFGTVIDMRTEGEDRGMDEVAETRARGMTYVSLPIARTEGVSFDNAQRLDDILAGIEGPVLLHCGSGERVAALLALRASLNGASDEDALAVAESAGLTRMEPVVRKRLEEREADPGGS